MPRFCSWITAGLELLLAGAQTTLLVKLLGAPIMFGRLITALCCHSLLLVFELNVVELKMYALPSTVKLPRCMFYATYICVESVKKDPEALCAAVEAGGMQAWPVPTD